MFLPPYRLAVACETWIHLDQFQQGTDHRLPEARLAPRGIHHADARYKLPKALAKESLCHGEVQHKESEPDSHGSLRELVAEKIIWEDEETHQYEEVNPRGKTSCEQDRPVVTCRDFHRRSWLIRTRNAVASHGSRPP
jgi:hypothetical protein